MPNIQRTFLIEREKKAQTLKVNGQKTIHKKLNGHYTHKDMLKFTHKKIM
jgi:hypothetical protein